MFGSNHTVRNTLSAAVVGGAAMFTAFSAAGQQVANLDADRTAHVTARCGSIADRVQRSGCIAEEGLRFDENAISVARRSIADSQKAIAEGQKTIADAQRETDCANQLVAGARGGDARFSPERGRAILNGKSPRDFGFCNLRDALTKS